MQRSRASTMESISRSQPQSPAVRPIVPLSDRQTQLFGNNYTVAKTAVDQTPVPMRTHKSFEASSKTSARACKGTPPPLPTRDDDPFGLHSSSPAAKQAAYQLFQENYDCEEAYNETDAPPNIALVIDQEGFREVEATLNFVSFNLDSHTFEYAVQEKTSLPYNWSKMQSDPVLRKLMVPLYGEKDFLTRQASLTLKDNGVWEVSGREGRKGNWKFTYQVEDRLTLLGKAKSGEKNIIPLRFTCSPEVLDSSRKVRSLRVVGDLG